MTSAAEDLVGTVTRIGRLPYGLARSEAAAAAVRRAEEPETETVLPYALAGLVDALFWGGEATRALVPFSRLTRLREERPEHFDEVDTSLYFGAFAWMLGGLQDDPTVPAASIENLLTEMEQRYAVAGLSRHAPAYERLRWSVRMERDDADAAYAAWLREPDEPAQACEHCHRTRQGIFLVRGRRYAEAVAVLEAPGLPEEACSTEPADMLSVLALAHLENGDPEAAVRVHRAAVAALARAETDMVGARGRRIALLGRGGETGAALAALVDDQHLLHRAITPFWHLQLLLSVASATGVMRVTEPDRPVRLRDVPATTIAELDTWVRERALALADAFGARAGSPRTRERALAIMDAPAPPPIDLSLSLPRPAAGSGDAAAAPADAVAPTGDDLLARAEREAAAGDDVAAVASYLASSQAARSSGRLLDAGFALAEAARLTDRLGDVEGAHLHYREAVALLTEARTAASDVAPVLVAWAQAATRAGETGELLGAVGEALAVLDVAAHPAAAHLLDARARVLAEIALGDDRPATLARAASDAVAAGEAFAAHGAIDDAGHAFWLAGRLHEEVGESDAAVWGLESAVEAFTLVNAARSRADAAGELVALLRERGQDLQADEVLAALSGRSGRRSGNGR
ncbi:hypothetical protein C8046_17430 [Serinibacter arcticus]|uniref:Tetratricopeptide repeat protein n=1 Tax=Serinibacter arcticus TaxID=1655435 RepID=A0A2U1ZYT8_9MICO|nr:hypothetical protein [Serinibacter arcticus]PWD52158.1 hypothetical protein C8046_17430 [Serinibacter arcticus]